MAGLSGLLKRLSIKLALPEGSYSSHFLSHKQIWSRQATTVVRWGRREDFFPHPGPAHRSYFAWKRKPPFHPSRPFLTPFSASSTLPGYQGLRQRLQPLQGGRNPARSRRKGPGSAADPGAQEDPGRQGQGPGEGQASRRCDRAPRGEASFYFFCLLCSAPSSAAGSKGHDHDLLSS